MRDKTDVKKILEGIDAMLSRITSIEERLQAVEDRLGVHKRKEDESVDSVLAEWMYGEDNNGSDR